MNVIISGGGTGGHIFPAISIAQQLRKTDPQVNILFVGAEGKMEMEKVPAAGFPIKGLPVAGLQRKLSLKNLALPFKVVRSYIKAGRIIRSFKPDIAIGVGGYASAPLLWCAGAMGIPCLIQEQNSYAGLTNRTLGKKARKVCVAYEGMEKFFPADKIVFTGNPIREGFAPSNAESRAQGLEFYSLDPSRKQILIIGGSLGCRTLNESMKDWILDGCPQGEDVEVLWQCGKFYFPSIQEFMKGREVPNVHPVEFVSRMDLAYAAADIVISRSGASSISEICVCRKAAIFVPSPNVAEDHQTCNAMALVGKGAARMVKDCDARTSLMKEAVALVHDKAAIEKMEEAIAPLGITDAAQRIVREVYGILGKSVEKDMYFIGIGGIGMSAIARYCKEKGYRVSGYDRTRTPLTEELESEGIAVHYEDDCSYVPSDKERTTVVYTPAVPADMGEMKFVMENGYKVVKRSRMLGVLSEGMHCLAVAGTHGKTTTSTLLSHIMQTSGKGCNAFLGGISKNYGTNMLTDGSDIMVAEADEFDRSFLQLHPEIAVVTAMDADHLDIYNDLEHVQEAFRTFASQVSGTLICKAGLPISEADTGAKILHYSLDDAKADFFASDIRVDKLGHYLFTLNHPGGKVEDIRCGVPGWVNVENSVAAAAAALCFGVEEKDVASAIESFCGVQRRFDIHVNTPSTVYIDDYAHHPEELSKAISSIRGMFPGCTLTAIFQPHLYTRTRDFADEFAQALSGVDSLILLDIYPARELPIEGVTSKIILDKVSCEKKMLISKAQLMDTIASLHLEKAEGRQVLATFGAGDICNYTDIIATQLSDTRQ